MRTRALDLGPQLHTPVHFVAEVRRPAGDVELLIRARVEQSDGADGLVQVVARDALGPVRRLEPVPIEAREGRGVGQPPLVVIARLSC